MELPDGYHDVPPGKIASVVTCLEMRARPPLRPERPGAPWAIERVVSPDSAWYRDLYARVGTGWLWFSRLAMADQQLRDTLSHPGVEVHALSVAGRAEGLLELDFRRAGACELAFFGLTQQWLGQGAGRSLMNRGLERAWARPIDRLWVHTCTIDHPGALEFYIRSGFRPYARQVEIADDPRLTGVAPRSAAPQVPLIEPGGPIGGGEQGETQTQTQTQT